MPSGKPKRISKDLNPLPVILLMLAVLVSYGGKRKFRDKYVYIRLEANKYAYNVGGKVIVKVHWGVKV